MSSDDAPSEPSSEAREHFDEGEEAAPRGVRAMAIVRWLLVAMMAAAALASFLYVFGDSREAQGDLKAQVYYCPMHPAVVQDHPGECPICSMSLVPRPSASPANPSATERAHTHARQDATAADASTAGGTTGAPAAPAGVTSVDLSSERIQLIGMRTARAVRAPIASQLRSVGYVAPTESGLASVQTRFAGWIQELHVRETGQPVKRGQLLARVYSPELLAAQQELVIAKRWSPRRCSRARTADWPCWAWIRARSRRSSAPGSCIA
jgi:Cu(I)/Ag(I) efflux system membrane fusion protein